MAARNDITGDEIKSKTSSSAYEDGWDRIFGKKEPTVQDKIKDRMDHLQQLMEGNNHLSRMEYVLDVVESVSKFWSALSEEDKDYIQTARYAIEEQREWNIPEENKLVINEDDGYTD